MRVFKTPSQFQLYIEELVQTNSLSYLETITEFCDENLIDYQDVVKLIQPVLKQKIKDQSRSMFSMPTDTTYTFDDD